MIESKEKTETKPAKYKDFSFCNFSKFEPTCLKSIQGKTYKLTTYNEFGFELETYRLCKNCFDLYSNQEFLQKQDQPEPVKVKPIKPVKLIKPQPQPKIETKFIMVNQEQNQNIIEIKKESKETMSNETTTTTEKPPEIKSIVEKITCNFCNEEKNISDFYIQNKATGKRETRCKDCKYKRERERNGKPLPKKLQPSKPTPEVVINKTCNECNELKPITEFYENRKYGKIWVEGICKSCRYLKRKEKVLLDNFNGFAFEEKLETRLKEFELSIENKVDSFLEKILVKINEKTFIDLNATSFTMQKIQQVIDARKQMESSLEPKKELKEKTGGFNLDDLFIQFGFALLNKINEI